MAHDSVPASHRDLLDGRFATLATVGEDGYPQVSEVWFLAEGDQIVISLSTARQKTQNLSASPPARSFFSTWPIPTGTSRSAATRRSRPTRIGAFAEKVGAKYDADLSEYDRPGDERVVVRIVPVRINAVDMSG